MASNVVQVEVHEAQSGMLCDAIAKMFCDFGDISVKQATRKLYWVDFEHFS